MLEFFAAGTPIPKGSAKAFINKKTGAAIITQDNGDKQKPWASIISYTAQQAGARVQDGPMSILITLQMPRLKSHFGTCQNATKLKDGAPVHHTSKPDLDKLIRCVKDALTGVAWHDDSQVSKVGAIKIYADAPGAVIRIERIK